MGTSRLSAVIINFLFFLMLRRPPRPTLTVTPCPYPTLFRSHAAQRVRGARRAGHDRARAVRARIPTAVRRRIMTGLIAAPTRAGRAAAEPPTDDRSEEHTSELQSLMRISYAVFCLKKKKIHYNRNQPHQHHTNNHT